MSWFSRQIKNIGKYVESGVRIVRDIIKGTYKSLGSLVEGDFEQFLETLYHEGIKDPLEDNISVLGRVIGGVVDNQTADRFAKFGKEYGIEIVGAVAGGIALGPYIAGEASISTALSSISIETALSVAGAVSTAVANKEKSKIDEENFRRRASRAQLQAREDSTDILNEFKFEQAEAISDVANTGIFSGARSFSGGGAVSNILRSNQERARELSKRIIDRGGREADDYNRNADQTKSLGRKQLISDIIGGTSDVSSGITRRKGDALKNAAEKKDYRASLQEYNFNRASGLDDANSNEGLDFEAGNDRT